jgi:hypothetical protein
VGDARVESSRALAGDLAAREPRPAGASGNRTTSVEYVLTGTRSRMVRRGADVCCGAWRVGGGDWAVWTDSGGCMSRLLHGLA